jgi:hypothetical protein
MFRQLLLSIVVVPVLLGIQAAKGRRERAGLVRLLALLLTFDVLYWVMLYYVRYRWVS